MNKLILVVSILFVSGCAALIDTPRTIVGYSVRDLESSRSRAVAQVLDGAFVDVYEAVLELAEQKKLVVFMNNEVRGLIVLMGIPGVVDTTEVGVFLSVEGEASVKVEIASRSTPAQRAVARILFDGLGPLISAK